MSTMSKSLDLSRPSSSSIARWLWRQNKPLGLIGFFHIALAFVAIAGMVLDPRVLTGQLIWVKPFKFSVSIAVYTLTLTWLLSKAVGRRRWIALVAWGTAIGFSVEIIAIVTQVVRGVRSHFNFTTPFDAALYGAMGAFVILIWAMNIVAAGLLLMQRFADRAFAWSLRLGLIVTVVGAGLGNVMVNQRTEEQVQRSQTGLPELEMVTHAVGVPDGGPGLPLTGWSTEGGDIRVPHFIGLHAMQVLPLLGVALTRRRRWWRLDDHGRLIVV